MKTPCMIMSFFFFEQRLSKRNEDLLNQENRQLQEELDIKRDNCENLDNKLQQKVGCRLWKFLP